MKTLAVATALWLALQPAAAQNKSVFRCEDNRGRVTYSDEPCRGGRALAHTDERSAEQRQAAADVVQREQRLADRLARERIAAEKAARPGGAALIPHSAALKAAAPPPRAKASSARKKKAAAAAPTPD